jgi:CRP-like cAMP-binding protein
MGRPRPFAYDFNHMIKTPQGHATLLELLPPELKAGCDWQDYPKGSRLFHAGQRPSHMFWVHEGQVVLERPATSGSSVVLQRTLRGFVSEASLQSARYHCDASVVIDARITRVPVPLLLQALKTDADFSLRWIGMLNQEVRRLRLQCERLSLKGVQARVLHWLETEGTQGCCAVTAGYKSLAAELGVSHEALYRALADMSEAGLVTRAPDRLCLKPTAAKPPHEELRK